MSVPSNVPFDPRQDRLLADLKALRSALADFRDALRPVNDQTLNDAFRPILDQTEQVVEAHLKRPGEHVANNMANLRSLFARHLIPREDPVLGRTPAIAALRSARGSVLADFDSVLDAARALGLQPSDPRFEVPASVDFQRAGHEGQLAGLERRLRSVETHLQDEIAPEGDPDEARSVQQIGLVNFYVDAMTVELVLAKLEATANAAIDFTGLARAIEAMGELTADFVATVEGLGRKVTEALRAAARAMRLPVRRVVRGLRAVAASVRREARGRPIPGDRFRDFDSAPEMIVVPAGKFMMGSPAADDDADESERPQHEVVIATPFAVGVSPITRGQFTFFIEATNYRVEEGSNFSWRDPGFEQADDHPVVCVNLLDAQAYVRWLGERSGGKRYRLLSEAEWEYCCRAGTTTRYSIGDEITPEHANFGRDSNGTTSITKFASNPWGLRDMHGNVWEWCEDSWHDDYEGAPDDGSVWQGGEESLRVLRGGSWVDDPRFLRSACRFGDLPRNRNVNVGFRVARTL
jgi:formylglycine-generating enzyme required for sulfatase activity